MKDRMMTYEQIANALATLCNEIMKFRDDNLSTLPMRDARHVCLFGFQTVIGAVALNIRWVITGRSLEEVNRILESFVTSKESDFNPRKEIESSWKFIMIALPHFRMDNFFQNVLQALGANPGNVGFGANMGSILSKITLSDQQHCQQVLSTWTHIRNSLHNNGVHRGADFRYKISGRDYEFKKNTVVNCADITDLLPLLQEGIQCVESIILAPEIRRLATIEDLSIELRYPLQ